MTDLIGHISGWLTVVGNKSSVNGSVSWICRCKCGKEILLQTRFLFPNPQEKKYRQRKTCGDKACVASYLHSEYKSRTNNLTGETFGRFKVLGPGVSRVKGVDSPWTCRTWRCQCFCGNIKEMPTGYLTQIKSRGQKTTCGCDPHKKVYRDLIGKEFGAWTVLSLSHVNSKKYFDKSRNRELVKFCRYWECKCSCGEIRSIRENRLLNGSSSSCGCRSSLVIDGFKFPSFIEASTYLNLKMSGKKFLHNKRYPGLGLMRYDFYLPDEKKYIETSSFNSSWPHWVSYLRKIAIKKRHVIETLECSFEFINKQITPEEKRHIADISESISGMGKSFVRRSMWYDEIDWTKSNMELSEEKGVCVKAIQRIRQRIFPDTSYQKRGRKNIDLSNADWSLSNSEIAKLAGCHYATVCNRRRKLFGSGMHPEYVKKMKEWTPEEQTLPERPDFVNWDKVDWSLGNRTLARIYHRAPKTVRQARVRHCRYPILAGKSSQ